MKIAHILHEFPYPPNHGIKCDMARRLEAFHALGHRVFAVSWISAGADEPPSPEMRERLRAITAGQAVLTIGGDLGTKLRRIANLSRYPSYVASRIPSRAEREALIAQIAAFDPDLIWLEGVHPAWLAMELQQRLGRPLAYRSHNIEHQYLAEQARLATSPRRKLALWAGTMGLGRVERKLHARASHVFDISSDDLRFWRSAGLVNNSCLPTQPDPAILATIDSRAPRDIDLLFLGGLYSPNNIAGLRWFLQSIYPAIRAEIPDVGLTIAGRDPDPELARAVSDAGATLIGNPPEAAPLFARARVTINPILHGSGVNIKTIDMLATGQPVITTSKGARGLPEGLQAELDITDTPEAFAGRAIAAVRAARAGAAAQDRRALIDRLMGQASVAAALRQIHSGDRPG
jgi:hypothetical protein